MLKRRNKVIIAVLLLTVLFYTACKNNKDSLPEHVTFTEHIAPILYKNCTICHRPEGTAHFSLVTYLQAHDNASSIAYVTKIHLMPPWPADPNYTHFVGERLLDERDIKMIAKWVQQGAVEGPKDKMPPLPDYPVGSTLGTPDMRIAVQPYFLPANSSDHFLLVKVPFELPKDTFASMIEFVPGRHNVVHHVNGGMIRYEYDKKKNVFDGDRIVDLASGIGVAEAYKKMDLANDDGSYPELQKSVVNYLPGAFGQGYPPGIGGYKLPRKGAFFFDDMHYGFTSKQALWDSSYVNIFFSRVPPERPVREFQLGTLGIVPVEPDLIIQPNTIKHVRAHFKVPIDISVLTVNPHMHLLGKSFKAYAITPAGDTIRLISIPKWDFNWQYFYTFKKMVKVPKGSVMIAEGVYDNTKENLDNPFTPPRLVRDQNGSMKSTDEMFQFIVTYLPYKPGDENISLERK